VNHLDVEEIMDEPDAVIGNFPINTFPALVLFGTGAFHSYQGHLWMNINYPSRA
jgi:hypothetical protein